MTMQSMIRMVCFSAAAAAFAAPVLAQTETTGSARRQGERRGSAPMRANGPVTTAALETMFDKVQRPDLEAAGIAEEKIQQLKDMDVQAKAAQSRGERLDFRALREKRATILTREEMQKLGDVRRNRRDSAVQPGDGSTTRSASDMLSTGAAVAQ